MGALRMLRAAGSVIGNTLNSVIGNPRAYSPVHMGIEPTNYCNQACTYCARQNSLTDFNSRNMPLEDFKRYVDQMPALQVLMIAGNGEPLLNDDIYAMISYAKSKGVRDVRITTNMTCLTPDAAARLLDSGVDEIYVSIDTVNPEKYRALRGTPIEPALRGLENLTKARKERGVFNSRPKVIVNCVINKLNMESEKETEQFMDVAKANGLIVNFKSMQLCGPRAVSIGNGDRLEIDRIKRYARKIGLKTTFYIKKREPAPFCYRVWYGSYIDAKGDMLPCCTVVRDIELGNVKTDGMKDVWNGSRFRDFRRNISNRDLSMYAPYVRQNCANCNLASNDPIHSVGKFFRRR